MTQFTVNTFITLNNMKILTTFEQMGKLRYTFDHFNARCRLGIARALKKKVTQFVVCVVQITSL